MHYNIYVYFCFITTNWLVTINFNCLCHMLLAVRLISTWIEYLAEDGTLGIINQAQSTLPGNNQVSRF